MNPTHHLPIDLDRFGFVVREYKDGKKVKNQCGRDFFYYCLNYYYPEKFNPKGINPEKITEQGVFGSRNVPLGLIWTGMTFRKIPKLLDSLSLSFYINGKRIRNHFQFLLGMMPFRPQEFEKSMKDIETAVDRGTAVGIDIAMALGGLLDHIMFVYGYDDENLYVFDVHNAGWGLEYEKLTPEGDNRFIMKLPKSAIKNRWTIFNRVWVVERK